MNVSNEIGERVALGDCHSTVLEIVIMPSLPGVSVKPQIPASVERSSHDAMRAR
jgi:hypothetical protein